MITNLTRALAIAAIAVAGTMTGTEIAVAVFVHPAISRLDDVTHVKAAQALAKILGAAMPFRYALSLLLTLAVTFRHARNVRHAAMVGPKRIRAFRGDDRLLVASSRSHQ